MRVYSNRIFLVIVCIDSHRQQLYFTTLPLRYFNFVLDPTVFHWWTQEAGGSRRNNFRMAFTSSIATSWILALFIFYCIIAILTFRVISMSSQGILWIWAGWIRRVIWLKTRPALTGFILGCFAVLWTCTSTYIVEWFLFFPCLKFSAANLAIVFD